MDSLTLAVITRRFATEEAAREYLKRLRWPEGPACPHCGGAGPARCRRSDRHKERRGSRMFLVSPADPRDHAHMSSGRWGRRDRRHRESPEDALERRLNAERAAAVAIVRTVREMLDAGKAICPPEPEWITYGVAEELAHAFDEVSERSRLQARALAECALEVAGQLDDSYPADIRATRVAIAWMNAATADLQAAAPRAALKCLEEADRALAGNPDLEPLRAIVDFTRATVLHNIGRDPEARRFAERAQAVLEESGNEDGLADCRELLAKIDRRVRRR